jgi:hypothetical protein
MRRLLLSTCLLALVAVTAQGQAVRTWVSGVGDDANPCSRTAPCKTWAGAISKTAVCGEIDALDPGGFGAVTITKSITLDGGGGIVASVLHSGVNGIVISIGSNDICNNTVILRNLSINGSGGASGATGLSSIKLLGSFATQLHVENCTIQHSQRGIDIQSAVAGSSLYTENVEIRHTTVHGIDINPGAGATVNLSLNDTRVTQSTGAGLKAEHDVKGTVSRCNFSHNANGVSVDAASVKLTLAHSILSENSTNGLLNGSTATTVIDGCTINGNATGVLNNTGGAVDGLGNNSTYNNTLANVTGTAIVTLPAP